METNEWTSRVAFLGPVGTFTELATKELFPNEWIIPFKTIPECIEAVDSGQVDIAVVPVENALEGSVPLTIDYLFHEADLFISAEVLSPIEQHLMMHKDQVNKLEQLERVYSHPHALAQCHKYLYYHFKSVPLSQTTSTAAAAQYVSEHPELTIAAIANIGAAKQYGLEIVEHNVHDFHFNHTRFFVLSKRNDRIERDRDKNQIKTTLMIKLPVDRSGGLHQVLSVFAWRQINLSKIESRPLKTGLGDYFFIIDLLVDENDALMKGALEELRALGCSVKSLGSYYTYQQSNTKQPI